MALLFVDLMTDTILLVIPLLLSAIQRPGPLYPGCQRPFQSLQNPNTDRNDIHVNVVNARRSRSEASLLTIYCGIKMLFYPIQYDKTHIPCQLLQIFRLPFFGTFTMIPSVLSSGNASLSNKLLLKWVEALQLCKD